jgi:hypothetical protein
MATPLTALLNGIVAAPFKRGIFMLMATACSPRAGLTSSLEEEIWIEPVLLGDPLGRRVAVLRSRILRLVEEI